jgi:hypothetical protein
MRSDVTQQLRDLPLELYPLDCSRESLDSTTPHPTVNDLAGAGSQQDQNETIRLGDRLT